MSKIKAVPGEENTVVAFICPGCDKLFKRKSEVSRCINQHDSAKIAAESHTNKQKFLDDIKNIIPNEAVSIENILSIMIV